MTDAEAAGENMARGDKKWQESNVTKASYVTMSPLENIYMPIKKPSPFNFLDKVTIHPLFSKLWWCKTTTNESLA